MFRTRSLIKRVYVARSERFMELDVPVGVRLCTRRRTGGLPILLGSKVGADMAAA